MTKLNKVAKSLKSAIIICSGQLKGSHKPERLKVEATRGKMLRITFSSATAVPLQAMIFGKWCL